MPGELTASTGLGGRYSPWPALSVELELRKESCRRCLGARCRRCRQVSTTGTSTSSRPSSRAQAGTASWEPRCAGQASGPALGSGPMTIQPKSKRCGCPTWAVARTAAGAVAQSKTGWSSCVGPETTTVRRARTCLEDVYLASTAPSAESREALARSPRQASCAQGSPRARGSCWKSLYRRMRCMSSSFWTRPWSRRKSCARTFSW
mmetsp:Transcript_90423/g.281034  ORF Transcript_90423/g.281034 Transcript_90423/m.281034 type:complete len:206 (+) Transcript_90423:12-629(+)